MSAPAPTGRSLVTLAPRPAASTRLVCFPSSGAGPAMFRPLARALPADIEPVAVCLPGREHRVREQPARQLLTLAAQVTRELVDAVPGPYLLFGHSMGAMLAYEVCRWLQRTGEGELPATLTVSACLGPDLPRSTEVIGQSDRRLTERLAALGGIPPEAARDPDLMRLILPVIRADLEMVEVYRPRSGPPMDLELLVVVGEEDQVATPAQMTGWPPTALRSSLQVRPGGHFYLLDPVNRAWLADRFSEQAARARLAGETAA
jgi:surfactin synthase thioesterase subunit